MTRVSKESIFSGLNNLNVCSVLSGHFSDIFGFTQAEVDHLMRECGKEDRLADLKKCYDGYRFGSSEIYNPWSVIQFVDNDCEFRPYWLNTSGNSILQVLLEHNDARRKKELEGLLLGKPVKAQVRENIVYGDIEADGNTLFMMLLTSKERMIFMNVRRYVLALAIGIIMWLPQPTEAVQTSEGVRITLVHTNDTHTRIKPEDNAGKSMGWAMLAAAVKKERELNPDTLVLDAGDTFHGLPLATLSSGETMVPLLNLTGYDAMCPGNQDFNYGVPRLLELSKELNFPVLAANVAYKDSGQLIFAPYKEFNLSGVKIAVFGLVTPETMLKVSPLLTRNLSFLDPVQQAQLMVDKLRPNNDLVIAVTHLGIDPVCADKSTMVAQKVKGIDIIIDGHSHTVLPQGIKEGDTLICQTGCYDSYLGEVNVTINNHRVVNKSARLLGLEEVNQLASTPDQDVLREIEHSTESAQPILDKVIGKSSRELQYNREQIRTGETMLGDYAADAYRGVSGADIAIVNAGTFRADIPKGTITRGDAIAVFPFGNVVRKIQVTGAQVKEALEHGVSKYPADVGIFPQISGISFILDSSAPAGKRVVSVEVNGQPLDLTQKYSLAVTNFMHIGGDGYTMLVNSPILGEYGLADEVLAAWISRGENLHSFGERIHILGTENK